MEIAPFELERWFAEHEHEADLMLAESGIRSLAADRFDTDPGPLDYVVPTNGDPAFRGRVAERYGRDKEEVLFTCGTQEANFLTFLTLLSPGDHAVVVTPTYQSLRAVPESLADVTTVDLSPPRWRLDPDAVADAMRPETELVVLANPNNPTGRYHGEEVMQELYGIVADGEAYLFCDEVYRLLAEDPIPPVASLGPRGISTASVTKAYGLAGLRFGWLVADRDVVDAAWTWKDYTTISPSTFGQHVARQAMGSREETILSENRELARENRSIVRAWVETHDLDWYDPVGVNGFIRVPESFANAEAFCRTVVERESVVLAPGEAFGFPEYFRLGFGLATADLTEGLERIGRVIDANGGSTGAT